MDFQLAVAIDSETRLFDRGIELAPEVACISYCWNADTRGELAFEPGLITRKIDMQTFLLEVLEDPRKPVIVGQNFAYDVWVFMRWLAGPGPSYMKKLWFQAYDEGRIHDTMLNQRLIDIAHGCLDGKYNAFLDKKVPYYYSLAALYERHELGKLDKGAERMTFGELIGTPQVLWPAEHVHYAKKDALATLQVWTKQQEHQTLLRDAGRQAKYAMALQKLAINGMHTDGVAVEEYINYLQGIIKEAEITLLENKLLRKDGSRDTKLAKRIMEAVCAEHGIEPKRTKPPSSAISLDAEAMKAIEGLSPLLEAYSLFSQSQQILQRAEALRDGSHGLPLQTQYVSLLENGRVSSRIPKAPICGVQIQNLPRKGKLRECFVPQNPDTHFFCSIDFASDEIACFAQAEIDLTGTSLLGEAVTAGKDVHCMVAAQLLGCTYEEVLANKKSGKYKDARQLAKGVNFGGLGGLGAKGFMHLANRTAKTPADRIDERTARKVISAWLSTWKPEKYFDQVRGALGGERDGRCNLTQLRSGRVRGMLSFTEACNSLFSGLAADGNKSALYECVKACELLPLENSPFAGCRVVCFLHDEIMFEIPKATATASAEALCALMLETKKSWTPDVKAGAEPALMERWFKDAAEVRDPLFNTLLPWKPDA